MVDELVGVTPEPAVTDWIAEVVAGVVVATEVATGVTVLVTSGVVSVAVALELVLALPLAVEVLLAVVPDEEPEVLLEEDAAVLAVLDPEFDEAVAGTACVTLEVCMMLRVTSAGNGAGGLTTPVGLICTPQPDLLRVEVLLLATLVTSTVPCNSITVAEPLGSTIPATPVPRTAIVALGRLTFIASSEVLAIFPETNLKAPF